VVSAQSMCGRQAMVVVMVTAVAVTATQTVYTHCQLAVLQRMVLCHGTLNLVPLRWPQPTVVEAYQNDKLYVTFVTLYVK